MLEKIIEAEQQRLDKARADRKAHASTSPTLKPDYDKVVRLTSELETAKKQFETKAEADPVYVAHGVVADSAKQCIDALGGTAE